MAWKSEIYERIAGLSRAGRCFAVATVTEASAGSPRKSGARMIVHPGGRTEFTVGGGNLEAMTLQKALEALDSGENASLDIEFEQEKSGMICGGHAKIFIEVFREQEEVLIFGAGHIGQAMSKYLDILGTAYSLIDDRREMLSESRFPNAHALHHWSFKDPVPEDIRPGENSYCLIVTHGHEGDHDVLRELLSRPSLPPYIGMIGSRKKVAEVTGKIKQELPGVDLSRVHAPVGLDLGGDSPEEIALSILAEMMMFKNRRTGRSLGGPAGESGGE